MSLTKDVEALSNIPLFTKVNPAKLKLLAFTSERLEYLSGDELFHPHAGRLQRLEFTSPSPERPSSRSDRPLEELGVVPAQMHQVRVELRHYGQLDLLAVELLEQAPGRTARQ
jgi:hypothetical protein